MDETDAATAEAQFSEGKRDPDLDLWPPRWEHILVSVRIVHREGSKARLRLLFWLCRVLEESSPSVEGLHVDTVVADNFPLFARIFIQLRVLDGVERLLGYDQAPSKRITRQQMSGNLLFFATCASWPHQWIVHPPLFVFFSTSFRKAIEGAEQPPNERRRNSSFLRNRGKLTPSFRCLPSLLPPKVQQKTVFSIDVQVGWLCHARCPFDRSRLKCLGTVRTINSRERKHGEWTCSTNISARKKVKVASPPHVYLGRGFCATGDRPAQVARICKGQMCNTLATNEVHIDE